MNNGLKMSNIPVPEQIYIMLSGVTPQPQYYSLLRVKQILLMKLRKLW
jgi:hypothetical protein